MVAEFAGFPRMNRPLSDHDRRLEWVLLPAGPDDRSCYVSLRAFLLQTAEFLAGIAHGARSLLEKLWAPSSRPGFEY